LRVKLISQTTTNKADDGEEGIEESSDEVTIGNWTRRGVVVVDEISRQIDTSATDRFSSRRRVRYNGLWLMFVGVDKNK